MPIDANDDGDTKQNKQQDEDLISFQMTTPPGLHTRAAKALPSAHVANRDEI
jgi:hypothetical protein